MNTTQKSRAKKYYWYGLLMIIPNVGFIAGVLLLRKGIILKDRILCFIGASGILLTGIFFVAVLFYSKYSNVGKAGRVELAQYSIDHVMRDIELYKLQFNHYPDSLQELKSVEVAVFIMDPLSQKGIFSRKLEYLNYQKIDSVHYTLFSSGIDQIPYTADDVYPYISDLGKKRFGFIRQSK